MEEGLLAAGLSSSVFSLSPILPNLGVLAPSPWQLQGGSPGPASRRSSNSLRQCDSLENVCDGPFTEQLENGLGLASQTAASAAISLPHINQLSDYEEDQPTDEPQTETSPGHDPPKQSRNNKRADKGKKAKLKRRRAYYRTPKDGRSKSLTHIDTLEDSGMLLSGEEMEGREGATDKLGVPDPHSIRRRKLSLATKVSSCEYLALVLECYDEPLEEFVQATRGTSLRSLFVPSLPSQEVGRTRNVKGNLRMVRNFLVKRL